MTDEQLPFDEVKNLMDAMSDEKYTELITQAAPELDGGRTVEDENLSKAGWPGYHTEDVDEVSAVAVTDSDEKGLTAYLACALTGLDAVERDLIFSLSHLVANACRRHDIALYEPRNITDPVHHPDVADYTVWREDRDRVLSSDLLIHLAHFPSTGSGEELSFAYDAMVPIVVISRADHRVSRMVLGIPGMVYSVTYTTPEEIERRLDDHLTKVQPLLTQRRMALTANNRTSVGQRIRLAREAKGLTIEELSRASAKRVLIDARDLQAWETSPDHASNLSLVQLRELSVLLGVTVGDLVDPPGEGAALSYLERYIDRQAARGSGPRSEADQRAIRRQVLDRLVENLDL